MFLGLSLGLCQRRSSGGGTPTPTPSPSAPVLSNLSSGWTTGANPPNWDTAYSGTYYDPDDFTGDALRIRWSLAGGSVTTEAWVAFDVTLLSDGFTYAFLTDGTLNAGGVFVVEVQAGRNFSAAVPGGTPALTSSWSNTWTDTLSSASETASTLNPTTGVNKNAATFVSGANLVGTGQSGYNFAPISIRATNARDSQKRQVSAVLSTYSGSPIWFGVDDGTTDFNTGFVRPGKNNAAGCSIYVGTTDWAMYVGNSTTPVQSGTNSSGVFNGIAVAAANDEIAWKFDPVGGTVSFYNMRSGVERQYGTSQAVTLTHWYANIGFENADAATMKFGTGQARTKDTGYVNYDN